MEAGRRAHLDGRDFNDWPRHWSPQEQSDFRHGWMEAYTEPLSPFAAINRAFRAEAAP